MKSLLLGAIAAISTVTAAVGQEATSTIRIRLSDGSPLVVGIDDRRFNKVNTVLTIGNIPSKKHLIKVYKYTPYNDRNGGSADLLFSSKIDLDPGQSYEGVVDVNTRELTLDEVDGYNDIGNGDGTTTAPAYNDNNSSDNDGSYNGTAVAAQTGIPAYLESLKSSMDKQAEDLNKANTAIQYLNSVNTISTEDVQTIAGWLMFDDSKIKFVKEAYKKVSDKENYSSLATIFTMPASKSEFQAFLQND